MAAEAMGFGPSDTPDETVAAAAGSKSSASKHILPGAVLAERQVTARKLMAA